MSFGPHTDLWREGGVVKGLSTGWLRPAVVGAPPGRVETIIGGHAPLKGYGVCGIFTRAWNLFWRRGKAW